VSRSLALRFGACLSLALVAAVAAPSSSNEPPPARPSVIFFIGDGMGMSQVTLGRVAAQARGEDYHFDRFRTIGLASTRSANWVVTDSAAAATALSSGFKTNNQAIGVDPEGKPLKTILEVAHEAGLATGLVTTTRITHATPACFVAHVQDRDEEGPIAGQIVEAARKGYPEVLIGGGRRQFNAEQQAALREAGYSLVLEPGDFAAAKGPKLAALMADSHLPYAIDRPAGDPSLTDLTRKAVEVLSMKEGPFFLMVEGGRIDHACHEHDAATCAFDQLDFDRAVGWAFSQATERADLLVVVTADHATGDLGIAETVKLDKLLAVKASAELLTRKDVDTGDADQALAFVDAVKAATGVELTPDETRVIWTPVNKYYARTKLGHIVSSRYGVEFYDVELQETQHTNTHGHDGAMVGVFAVGAGANRFAGVYENTEIPRRIAQIMELPLPGLEGPH
jgi:alkaline phosphatase